MIIFGHGGSMQDLAYYTCSTVLIVLMMVAMIVHVLNYVGFNKEQKGWFTATYSAISFCALAEFAIQCGYYNNVFKIPLTILTILQFAVAPCFAPLFAGALGLKNQLKFSLIFFGICLVIGIVCAPFELIIHFDPVNGYERGPAFLIYEITYFVSIAYLIGALIIVEKKFRNRDLLTIIMILIILAVGISVMSIYQIHVGYVTVGFVACISYVFYNDLVQEDTRAELVEKQQKLSEMQTQIISRLANLIESRDTETGGHVARTSSYVKALAEDALAEGLYNDEINQDYIQLLTMLSPMHDVGKILVSDQILRKPGRLTPEEFEDIKKHAANGGDIVRQILDDISDEAYVKFAIDIATYHHERWNGKGYPKGLKEKEIPLSARIMAIADVFDALISKRCYKEAMPIEEAFKTIEEESGTHFDPKLVEVFLKNKEKYIALSDGKNK